MYAPLLCPTRYAISIMQKVRMPYLPTDMVQSR